MVRKRFMGKWETADMEHMIEKMFSHLPRFTRMFSMGRGMMSPDIDIYDQKENLLIKAEIPGIRKEDIHVNVEGDILTIRGEKKREPGLRESDCYYCERNFGMFSRTVTLPATVEPDHVKATYTNGVLSIELEKSPEAKRKEIQIEVQ